ncbi:MAG TPA: hypothetical protein VEW46_05595 [Pyrinomonadaceae bacterium]|nr:hypothetical protein [Pyrinomonadaceae bacterium]
MTTSEELVTRKVVLPDGRYLIYYTVKPDDSLVPSEPAQAETDLKAETRDEEN